MADKQALIDGLNEDLNLELEAVLLSSIMLPPPPVYWATNCARWPRKIWPANWYTPRFWPTRSRRSGASRTSIPGPRRSSRAAKEMLLEDVAAERAIAENYRRHIELAEALGKKGW